MNAMLEILDAGGRVWIPYATSVLWQVSGLVAALLLADRMLARRLRAVVRHALWLLVPLKLLLPPGLALPTSPAYWLENRHFIPEQVATGTLPYHVAVDAPVTTAGVPLPAPSRPPGSRPGGGVSVPAGVFTAWLLGGCGFIGLLFLRCRLVRRMVRSSRPAPRALSERFQDAAATMGVARAPQLGITDRIGTPSVCGLFRPVVLLPESLVDRLEPARLSEVFLHELAHVKRGDPWSNHLQTLLQVVFWWHPMVWVANARMRRVREEATDEMVIVALEGGAESYAQTLVDVARSALRQPMLSLGLIGILERRNALRHRVHRLLSLPTPRSGVLGPVARLAILASALVLLPMAPRSASETVGTDRSDRSDRSSGPTEVTVAMQPRFFRIPADVVERAWGTSVVERPVALSARDAAALPAILGRADVLEETNAVPLFAGRGVRGARAEDFVPPFPGSLEASDAAGTVNFLHRGFPGVVYDRDSRVELIGEPEWTATPEGLRSALCSVRYLEGNGQTVPFHYPVTELRIGPGTAVVWAWRDPGKATCEVVVLTPLPSAEVPDEPTRSVGPAGQSVDQANPSWEVFRAVIEVDREGRYSMSGFARDLEDLVQSLHRQWGAEGRFAATVRANASAPSESVAALVDALRAEPGCLSVVTERAGSGGATAAREVTAGSANNEEIDGNSGHNRKEAPKRVTRVFRVEPVRFSDVLKRAAVGASADAGMGEPRIGGIGGAIGSGGFGGSESKPKFRESTDTLVVGLRTLMERAGVSMRPPNAVFFNDRIGLLMVRATQAEIEAVEPFIEMIPASPPQILIETRIMEGPAVELGGLGLDQSTGLASEGVLTTPRAGVLRRVLDQRTNVVTLAAPRIVTLSGRRAAIEVSEREVGTHAISASLHPGSMSVDVLPEVAADGYTLRLSVVARLTQVGQVLQGAPSRSSASANSESDSGGSGAIYAVNAIGYINYSLTNSATLYDGQTLLIRGDARGLSGNRLLVTVTPTLIDPAGNRIHTEGNLPFPIDQVPEQPRR